MNAPNPTTIDSPRTVADAIADTRLDQLLDDAIAPKCEIEDDAPQCGNPATWLVILSCGHAAFECSEHAESLHESLDAHIALGYTIQCDMPREKSPWHPRPMVVTVRFERIAS